MKRDERLFLVAVGEASGWDTFCTRMETVMSRSAKARLHQYAAVSSVLSSALTDPDDLITINIRKPRGAYRRRELSLLLLGLLLSVLFVEWRTYTYPAVAQFLKYFAHQCGLQ